MYILDHTKVRKLVTDATDDLDHGDMDVARRKLMAAAKEITRWMRDDANVTIAALDR